MDLELSAGNLSACYHDGRHHDIDGARKLNLNLKKLENATRSVLLSNGRDSVSVTRTVTVTVAVTASATGSAGASGNVSSSLP